MPFWKKENYSDASPTCTNCGAVYPRDARFCPQCGGKVEAPPAPTPAQIPQQPQTSAFDELAKLAALRDQGIVTELEFQEQKKKLLGTQSAGEEVKLPTAPTPTLIPEQVRQGSSHCPQCGRLNDNRWELCPYCGTRLIGAEKPVRLIKATKPVKKTRKKMTTEQKRKMLEAQDDLGLALSGPLGWALLGRRQNKRKQETQQQRIESLLRDIRDKK
jgi:RNA polymerase subunit RPABC4/transcription elongation factor Spt4